jgi:hypothetical protein
VRQVLFDRHGEPVLYLTGAGVVYTVENEPVGCVVEGALVDYRGEVLGYLEGGFLWSCEGEVIAFVKGAVARGGLKLPETKRLTRRLAPRPAPVFPMLRPHERPELRWRWAERSLASLLGTDDREA